MTGGTGDGVADARARVARRDAEIADADRQLVAVLGEAHRLAAESIRRIEAARAEIDELAHSGVARTAAGACDLSRTFIARQREIHDLVAEARSSAAAKAAVLQRLSDIYRAGPRSPQG